MACKSSTATLGRGELVNPAPLCRCVGRPAAETRGRGGLAGVGGMPTLHLSPSRARPPPGPARRPLDSGPGGSPGFLAAPPGSHWWESNIHNEV